MGVVARHQVDTDGGLLSVLSAGAGEPVLLLHGVPTGAELWRELLAGLAADGYHGLAPDLPGYGRTRLSADGDFSLAGVARLLAGWLRQTGLAPVWVVGHDLGGAVAQLLVTGHADVVSRLTLANSVTHGAWPAPRARVSTLAARAHLYRPTAALHLVPNAYLRGQVRRAFVARDSLTAADADRVFWDTKFSDPVGRRQFERHLAALTPGDTAPLPSLLPAVEVPCQLVWGMADVYQPWEGPGRILQSLLPGPAVTPLAGCGHFTPMECPGRVVRALLAWRTGR